MKLFVGTTLTLMKVGLLAAAVIVATFGLVQEPSAESASDTQIIFSSSDLAPVQALAIIVNPGGVPRDIYIWAVNVKNATGVSGFNLAVQYNDSDITVTSSEGDNDGIGDKTWLGNTNRQPACIADPFPVPGKIIGLCSTFLPPPPLGPTGNGLIGHIVVYPGDVQAPSSQLSLVAPATGVQGTFLLDTPLNPDDIQPIPLTLINSTIIFLGCADNSPPPNGDGIVDLPNDILGVILVFQMTSSNPDWNPAFDINDDGIIDLPNDILGTVLQFQLACTQN